MNLLRSWPALVDLACERDRYRFVCQAILAVSVLLLVVSFATTRGGKTAFGPELGADFAAFYSASSILNRPAPESARLYDRAFQNAIYHELLPDIAESQVNPFVHPPFVAWALSWLAMLDYPTAFGVWLAGSLTLYVAGLAILLSTTSALDRNHRLDVFLLALAFEPFVMECWLGGQLSAVGFACLATAIRLDRDERPFLTGLILGLLLYKFTLLVVLGPAFVFARRWLTLAGFGLTASALAVFSWFVVGEAICHDYLALLTGFTSNAVGAGDLVLRVWKWIDLNFFWRQLLGGSSTVQRSLFVVSALPLYVAALWHGGRRLASTDRQQRQVGWAILATATCVANLYLAIYDSVLAVAAAVLMADAWLERHRRLPDAFRALVVAVFCLVWLAQPLARASGVQVVTLLLVAALVLYVHEAPAEATPATT